MQPGGFPFLRWTLNDTMARPITTAQRRFFTYHTGFSQDLEFSSVITSVPKNRTVNDHHGGPRSDNTSMLEVGLQALPSMHDTYARISYDEPDLRLWSEIRGIKNLRQKVPDSYL
jgi:hypothetical protein